LDLTLKEMDTYVIVVTYNGITWIKECLESCKNHPVIVIDNASTDDTVAYIKNKFPKVVLLQQTKNLGFGAANNIGIGHALNNGADYVFLLNQDAYLREDTVEKLITIHKNNTEYGIISPIHLNGSGTNLDKNFSNYIKTNDTLFYDALKNAFIKSIYEVSFVNAAAWLLPKATLGTVGGFDPIFYHYAEDDNYCQRVLFHGFKIGVVPNCYINHDREFRTTESTINIKDKFILKERYLKFKWANVNSEVELEIRNTKKKLRLLIPKLFIKFKFNKASHYLKELALINRIIPEIEKSREINKAKGRHYIN